MDGHLGWLKLSIEKPEIYNSIVKFDLFPRNLKITFCRFHFFYKISSYIVVSEMTFVLFGQSSLNITLSKTSPYFENHSGGI